MATPARVPYGGRSPATRHRESLAIDRVELPPEEYAKRVEQYASLKEQQGVVMDMVVRGVGAWQGPPSHASCRGIHLLGMCLQPTIKAMLADPTTAALVNERASAHANASGLANASTEVRWLAHSHTRSCKFRPTHRCPPALAQQMKLAHAMQKLAMARQQMAEAGLDEQVPAHRAIVRAPSSQRYSRPRNAVARGVGCAAAAGHLPARLFNAEGPRRSLAHHTAGT
jgi:hypothetical protein